MLVIDVIESEIICKPSTKDRRTYWAERRRWWASHKAETGTDWAGIQRSLVEAAAYLAYLRNRAASHLSPEAIVAEPEPNSSRLRARRDSLPTASTCIALDWLLRYCDDERLRKFLEGRPEAELAKIKNYIAWKKSQ
jgi:hypothetical protein